jgi:hypothetical protein
VKIDRERGPWALAPGAVSWTLCGGRPRIKAFTPAPWG